MKFYGAVMITDVPLRPDNPSEWIEITAAQHSKIVNILMKNKESGMEVKKR